MDLQQLKIEFPEVYKACVDIGIEQERDRVVSHLELGRKTGAWGPAYAAIDSGATMTPALFTAYAQAGRAHIELEAWLEDDDVVEAALLNIKLPPSSHADPAAKDVLDRLRVMLDAENGAANIEDLEVGV